ncbi:MAG: hypothetical protein H0W83_11510 [Planctomycetes bacterium]|nr:hypothetical protein [Planctomycetota bacterium]
MRPTTQSALSSLSSAIALGLLLVGCATGNKPAELDPTTANVQEGAAADSALNQTMDAATESLANDASSPTTGVSTRSLPAHTVRSLDQVVVIASLVDASGQPLFPRLSGSFSVHTDGQVIPSSPTGATLLGTHTVTVVFDQGPVTYTEPTSGLVATLSSGSYTYQLDTSYHNISPQNWDVTLDALLTIPTTPTFAVTVARTGRPNRTVTVAGTRHAVTTLQRRNDFAGNNTTVVDRTVSGAATGVNPANTAEGYTSWTFTIGADTVVWNRFFHANLRWAYQPTVTRTINALSERIFITRNGAKIGPYTTLQLIGAFQTGMEH